MVVRTDGGCTGGVGTIGFVIYDPEGEEMVKVSKYG